MASRHREVHVKLNVDADEYREAIQKIRTTRARANQTAWGMELAVALGYEPESWDGVWKLTADPFAFGPDYVLVEEVVYVEGTHDVILDGDRFRTRHVRHPLPEGWTTEPVYRVVPPRA